MKLQGVDGWWVSCPLYFVHVVSGVFRVAVCEALQVRGVSVLLGNDIAGGKLFFGSYYLPLGFSLIFHC